MRKTMLRLALPSLLLCLALAAPAQAAAPGGAAARRLPDFLVGDPGFAELGALAEPLGLASLERAALLASGVTPDRAPAYESRIASLLEGLRSEAGGIADPAAKGEAILTFLHKTVFRSYGENATTLDGILDTGMFNCVSSAVLYTLAARELGLETQGVRTSDHAFCALVVGNRRIDVETTNPYGFDPGNKKEFKDSFGRATGFAYVAPGGYGDRRAIGDRALVGLILSNRASLLERRGRFAEATRLGADYDELCRDADSYAFLIDRINNLVADLESRRDFAGASAAAKAAAEAFPQEPRIASLAETASYNRAAALAQSGDWAGAFDMATALEKDLAPDSPTGAASAEEKLLSELAANALANLAQSYARSGDFAGGRGAVAERAGPAGPEAAKAAYSVIGDAELVRAANSLPFAKAVAAADRILASGEVALTRYAQALAAIYGNEAGRLGTGGDWLGGAALAEAGVAKLAAAKAPGDGGLALIARNLRRNFVAEAHNRFARLYNSGDYAGAAAAIEKALAAMPGEASLERDLSAARDAPKR
jgi:hypothetical protein